MWPRRPEVAGDQLRDYGDRGVRSRPTQADIQHVDQPINEGMAAAWLDDPDLAAELAHELERVRRLQADEDQLLTLQPARLSTGADTSGCIWLRGRHPNDGREKVVDQ